MAFKLLVLAVACFALFAEPADAKFISNLKSAATDTVKDIVSIVPNMIKAKVGGVVNAVAGTGAIALTGAGLKVRALERLSSSIKGAVSGGFISIGESLSNLGTNLVNQQLNATAENARIFLRRPIIQEVIPAPFVVEENIVVPCKQNVVEIPVESYPVPIPAVYDIINTPRVYKGPSGTFRIQK